VLSPGPTRRAIRPRSQPAASSADKAPVKEHNSMRLMTVLFTLSLLASAACSSSSSSSCEAAVRHVAALRARLPEKAVPASRVDDVITLLLRSMSRARHMSRVLEAFDQRWAVRDRVDDGLTDLIHRTFCGLRRETNGRRTPPRATDDIGVRSLLDGLHAAVEAASSEPAPARGALLAAAKEVMASRGYFGTRIDDITDAAGLSHGAYYHYFDDKEQIFDTLLSQYWAAIEAPDFPFNRALASGAFPDRLEELAEAAEESVKLWERHVALIYVDVVEMKGTHIQRFYGAMAGRFDAFHYRFIERSEDESTSRNAPGEHPPVMLASRIFLQYYAVEILFRVPDQFGKPSKDAIRDIAEILRRGMLRGGATTKG